MEANNSEKIDDLVDPKALDQLKELNKGLEGTFNEMVKVLGKTVEVEKSLSKIGTNYKDLTDIITKYETVQKKIQDVQKDQKTIEDQIVKTKSDVINKTREQTKEFENAARKILETGKASQESEKNINNWSQSFNKVETNVKSLSNFLKELENRSKLSDIAVNVNKSSALSGVSNEGASRLAAINSLQTGYNQLLEQGQISLQNYNGAMERLVAVESDVINGMQIANEKILALKDSTQSVGNQAAESFSSMTPRVQELLITITELKKEQDSLREYSKQLDESYKNGSISLDTYTKKKSELAAAEYNANKASSEAAKELKLQIQLANSAKDSYDYLSAQYSLNKIELNKLTQAQRENSEEYRKLEKETLNIRNRMTEMQRATGDNSLSVGNYKDKIKEALGLNGKFGETVIGITKALGLGTAAFGAAKFAYESYNSIMMSTRSTSIELTATIDGLKNGFGYLQAAIAHMDFTNFYQGLINSINLGAKASKMIAELQEMTNSFKLTSIVDKAELEELKIDLADVNKSSEERLRIGIAIIAKTQALAAEEGIIAKQKLDANKLILESHTSLTDAEKEYFITRYNANKDQIKFAQDVIKLEERAKNTQNSYNQTQLDLNTKLASSLTEQIELKKKDKNFSKEAYEAAKKYSYADLETINNYVESKYELEKLNVDTTKNLKFTYRTMNRIRKSESDKELQEQQQNSKKSESERKKRAQEEKKIEQDLAEFRAKQAFESDKKIVEDEKANYEQRLASLDTYSSKQKEAIDLAAENQISNLKKSEMTVKAYEDAVTLITEKAQAERNKIDEEKAKIRLDIQKDNYEKLLKEESDLLTKRNQEIGQVEQEGLLKASSAYNQGLINAEQYQQAKIDISRKASIDIYDAEIESLQKSLEIVGITDEQKQDIEKKLGEARIDYQKYVNETIISDEEKASEKRLEIEKQLADKRKELISNSLDFISTLFSAQTEKQLSRLNKESEANSKYYEEEEKKVDQLAEAGAITAEQADARKAYLAEQEEKRELALEEKRKEILQRQARFEKAMAMTRVIIDTSSAIMKQLALTPLPIGAPLVAAIAASGAIQLATILAQPIPEYAEGTKDHKGGLAKVGDGGKHEMVITPDGKIYKTPNTSTLVNLPAHTIVKPDFDKAIENMMFRQTIIPIENDKTIIISENKKQIGLAEKNNILLGQMIQGQNRIRQNQSYLNNINSIKRLGRA